MVRITPVTNHPRPWKIVGYDDVLLNELQLAIADPLMSRKDLADLMDKMLEQRNKYLEGK